MSNLVNLFLVQIQNNKMLFLLALLATANAQTNPNPSAGDPCTENTQCKPVSGTSTSQFELFCDPNTVATGSATGGSCTACPDYDATPSETCATMFTAGTTLDLCIDGCMCSSGIECEFDLSTGGGEYCSLDDTTSNTLMTTGYCTACPDEEADCDNLTTQEQKDDCSAYCFDIAGAVKKILGGLLAVVIVIAVLVCLCICVCIYCCMKKKD